MKLKENILGFIIVILIFGGITTASSLGLWRTTSSKIPITFNEGEFKGEYNPGDIRGSYTLVEVSDLFNVPLNDIAKAFNLLKVEDINSFKAKDFEEIYANLKDQGFEIGTDSLRVFISLYKGLPYELSQDTYLFKEAIDILKEKGNLSKEGLDFLNSNTISLSAIKTEINNVDSNDYDEEDERVVKGKTTFKDLLNWGISQDDIRDVIGEEMPNHIIVVRDYCQEKGLAFSTVKDALQDKIDSLNN